MASLRWLTRPLSLPIITIFADKGSFFATDTTHKPKVGWRQTNNFLSPALGRPYHFTFFKGCLPQILLGPFLNTLSHMMTVIQIDITNIFPVILDNSLLVCTKSLRIWELRKCENLPYSELATTSINPLTANVPIIQKPLRWFAEQINWLVSIWWEHWLSKG